MTTRLRDPGGRVARRIEPAAGADVDLPTRFAEAVAAARRASLPSGVAVEEVPAPRRIAPFAVAFTGRHGLTVDTDDGPGAASPVPGGLSTDLAGASEAAGRFVLLHDPACPDGWDGDQRVVAFLSAGVEADLAGDPLLDDIVWVWLVEELQAVGAVWTELGGTVTRVASTSFGCLDDRPGTRTVELRASWSPFADLGVHVEGWARALCRLAGSPVLEPGIVALPRRS